MTKDLEVIKQVNDVTVLRNGEAYISQRKLADLLGVHHSFVQRWIKRNCATVILNQNKALHYNSMVSCATECLRSGNKCSIDFVERITQAGAKAYLYTLAGYVMEAKKPEPVLTEIEIARNYLAALEREQAAKKEAEVAREISNSLREDLFSFEEKSTKRKKEVLESANIVKLYKSM
jgi:transcriptional regulator with XRE-family HTH domain